MNPTGQRHKLGRRIFRLYIKSDIVMVLKHMESWLLGNCKYFPDIDTSFCKELTMLDSSTSIMVTCTHNIFSS